MHCPSFIDPLHYVQLCFTSLRSSPLAPLPLRGLPLKEGRVQGQRFLVCSHAEFFVSRKHTSLLLVCAIRMNTLGNLPTARAKRLALS